MNEKYFMDQDNSGHNYIVEASRRDEWEAWLGLDEDDEASREVPDFARRIVEFHKLNLKISHYESI